MTVRDNNLCGILDILNGSKSEMDPYLCLNRLVRLQVSVVEDITVRIVGVAHIDLSIVLCHQVCFTAAELYIFQNWKQYWLSCTRCHAYLGRLNSE